MKKTWQIVAVPDRANDYCWVWEKLRNGNVVERAAGRFAKYDDCAEDARQRGYAPPRAEHLP